MSGLGLGACNVVNLHYVTRLDLRQFVGFGASILKVVDVHLVSDELGWGCWSDFNFGQVVVGVEGVEVLSFGLELDYLWLGARDIASLKIGLLFVESNVESSWA